MQYLLALDQGTTSSRTLLFDLEGNVIAQAQQEFQQHYPQSGWVEHDAEEIWQSQLATLQQVRAAHEIGRASCRERAQAGGRGLQHEQAADGPCQGDDAASQ